MSFYTAILRPLVFQLEAERAHRLALAFLARIPPPVLRMLLGARTRVAPRTVFGLRFPNPVGLAAGMDKSGEALPAWEALGFGFAEIGTITALPQPGNPMPRVFRYPRHKALVNRMGFNNPGADGMATRLAALRASGRWPRIPIGINIGKSKATPIEEAAGDYLHSFRRLAPFADYVAVNVSSPNTPGLRLLQDVRALRAILESLRAERQDIPLVVKIAPDLDAASVADIAGLAESCGVQGLIATNTTLDHSALRGCREEEGGLSGLPLASKAAEVHRVLAESTRLPVLASGGIMDASHARARFALGSPLVQIYTGFVYRGAGLIGEIVAAGDVPGT
jgi:dihydroorotate dehydrogenase